MNVRKIKSDYNTAIFKGDAVKSLNTGYIAVAGAGDSPVHGIFVGCKYLSTSIGRTVWSNFYPGADAAADVEAYVIDDPMCVFLAQTAGATGAVTLTYVGNNVALSAATAGSTATGISGQSVTEGSGSVTTSTLPFRVVGVPGVDIPNVGAAANGYDTTTKYNVVLVAFNSQDYKSLTGV